MRLLSLPTQELNKYCTLHAIAHWSGYVLWGEFMVNAEHDRFIRLIPEINTTASLFSINPAYYTTWASSILKVVYNVTP